MAPSEKSVLSWRMVRGAKPGASKIVRAESRAKNGAASSALADLEHVAALGLQPLVERIAIINHADVQGSQVQALHEGAEPRVILVKVDVRINRRESGKAGEIGVRSAGSRFGLRTYLHRIGKHHEACQGSQG